MNWDFIAIGDMHLRDDQPPCRTDDFWKTQEEKIDRIVELQFHNGRIPILQPGDLFHKWNPSHYLVQWAIRIMPIDGVRHKPLLFSVPGNHDLPNHNISFLNKSAFQVLLTSRAIDVNFESDTFIIGQDTQLKCFSYNAEITPAKKQKGRPDVALVHAFVYKDQEPFPGCTAPKAKQFLKQFKGFDVIISGDNHQQFEYETDNQLLINPGCFTRQRYDEKNTVPCAYLVNASQRKFEKIQLGAKNNVFQIPFEEDKKRKDKINLFVESLKEQKEIGLSFEDNLKAFIHKNKVPENIQSKIQEIVQ